MTRLFIHIGSQKTGTTSIQGFLKANKKQLGANGINYVQAGRTNIAHNHTASLLNKGEAKAVITEIIDEIEKRPQDTHILSSEIFFSAGIANRLARLLPDAYRGDTKIICYLRRPDKYLEAMYKQRVKNGRSAPDPALFLQAWQPKLSYKKTMDAFAEGFGAENIILRPFERPHFPNGNVVEDFCTHIGVADYAAYAAPDASSNKSLSAAVSELLGTVARHSSFNTRVLIRDIIRAQYPGSTRSGDVFPKETCAQIAADFADECDQLRATFCPDINPFFDLSDLSNSAPSPYPSLQEQLDLTRQAADTVIKAIANIK